MAPKKMLVKFENKSNRVKGIAFHSRRPWILASLHNGSIQLWDYRNECLIDTFSEHEGPVRGVHFHMSQPLFVSGGDDSIVKVWNYQLKRCLFNLKGHIDYIRTVQFHHEYPWILSASDDQTIRIWNWQSRTCLSQMTGHNHYVMCAQFHPKNDLVLSASLDNTVRVWDVSGLRKKNVSIAGSSYGQNQPANDIFGVSDVVRKHVLEGHTRGVNWASFAPNLSLIVSGADDNEVKLWRYNDERAWEVETFRGHVNNVSCVLFHPKKELIISNSEDKCIRVWDMSKVLAPEVHRRDTDRYWILDAHPKLNLLAAGHDSGLVVFKLARERPAFAVHESSKLYFYRDLYIYEYDFKTGKDRPILSTRRQRGANGQNAPRSLHYNSSNRSQHCILLCSSADMSYELYTFPKSGSDSREHEVQAALRDYGRCAVFVSRSRFAVLDKSRKVWLKNLKNETKREITLPNVFLSHLFEGGVGRLLLRSSDCMILYDIQSLKVIAELPTQSRHLVKYVVWADNHKYVAMFSRVTIYIANSKLEELCTINENTRIKSGAWDACGVFVYTTSTHIKYVLPNGDRGIVRTLDAPIYITSVSNTQLGFLDRETKTGKLEMDATEYLFKVALTKKRHKEVLRLMQSKKLVGQFIIGYLQEKGYPEVALHFVEDPKTKFSLALECGNIGVALEYASKLDTKESWHKLGVEALRQGNHQVVETAYQKTRNFDRLSFLYLITGNTNKLQRMLGISKLRKDLMGRFHNALYLGDVRERVEVLKDAGQLGLAYLTAKSHGLDEETAVLEEALGDSVPDVDVSQGKLFAPPNPILKGANWPLLDVGKGFFEDPPEEIASDAEEEAPIDLVNDPTEEVDSDVPSEAAAEEEEEEAADNDWPDFDIGGLPAADEGDEAAADDDDMFIMPLDGTPTSQTWTDNSTLPGDLVAAGAFDQAMHLLNRQIGVVNFSVMKPLFMAIHAASFCKLPQTSCSSYTSHIQRSSLADDKLDLPLLPRGLPFYVNILKLGYKAMTEGKFQTSLGHFRSILIGLPLIVVSNTVVKEVNEMAKICKEYITALRLEIERKKTKDPVRQAQLSAYFSKCKLQSVHVVLGLRVAIKCGYTIKNCKTTAGLCRRVLELATGPQANKIAKIVKLAQIKSVLRLCEKAGTDAHDIDFDESKAFKICCESFTAVYKTTDKVACPYCRSHYKAASEGKVCATCQMAKIGAEASGLVVCAS